MAGIILPIDTRSGIAQIASFFLPATQFVQMTRGVFLKAMDIPALFTQAAYLLAARFRAVDFEYADVSQAGGLLEGIRGLEKAQKAKKTRRPRPLRLLPSSSSYASSPFCFTHEIILNLAWKEIIQLLRDRVLLIFLIVAPFSQLILIAEATGGVCVASNSRCGIRIKPTQSRPGAHAR